MSSRVYSITQLDIGTTFAADGVLPALTVSARGKVNSGGWSNAELGPWSYVTPPEDGILDMDFLATPPKPGDIVSFGFVDVSARMVLPVPQWVKGVRVHTSTNSMEKRVDQTISSANLAGGNGQPWPWFVAASAPAAGILPPFDVKLTFPDVVHVNLMPPIPDRVTVRATATISVKNNSGRAELLTAATPCHIHHWDIFDQAGRLIESEKDELCLTIFQTKSFEPGETLRSDYVVAVNGKLLQDNARYKLRFKFWGFEGEAFFACKVVQ